MIGIRSNVPLQLKNPKFCSETWAIEVNLSEIDTDRYTVKIDVEIPKMK
jgi:hypothetical protein